MAETGANEPPKLDSPNGAHDIVPRVLTPAEEAKLLAQVGIFRRRAKLLNISAVAVLFGIAGIFGLGIYVFVQAGDITIDEAKKSAVTRSEIVRSQQEIVRSRQETVRSQKADLNRRVSALLSAVPLIIKWAPRFEKFVAAFGPSFPSIAKRFNERQSNPNNKTSDFERNRAEFVRTIHRRSSSNPEQVAQIEEFVRIEKIIAGEDPTQKPTK